MNISVRKKTYKVHGGAVRLAVVNQLIPCCGGKHLAGFDGFVDELGALRVNLTAAERVVADFGVAISSSEGRPTAVPCALI